MNERIFQRVEVWILDRIISLLSEQSNVYHTLDKLLKKHGQQPMIIPSIVLGSGFVGVVGGYLLFILTSQIR